MNKLSALALGAALALAAPLSVQAQGVDLGAQLDGGVGVDAGGDDGLTLDLGAGAQVAVDRFTHADVDAAIQATAQVSLEDVDAMTDIRIVSLSSLAANDGGQASVLADTRAAFDADISALQANVAANAEIVAALEAQGYDSGDVVAVSSQADGVLTIFVDA